MIEPDFKESGQFEVDRERLYCFNQLNNFIKQLLAPL